MCPNTEFFLVLIFQHSDWIRTDTSYLSVFSLNAGRCGPEKTPYLDTFHAVACLKFISMHRIFLCSGTSLDIVLIQVNQYSSYVYATWQFLYTRISGASSDIFSTTYTYYFLDGQKELFLRISQYSQENTCVGVFF